MRALASLRKKEEKPAEAAEAKAEAASSPAESSKVETGGFLLISLFFAHSVGDRKRAEPREARRRRANGRQTAWSRSVGGSRRSAKQMRATFGELQERRLRVVAMRSHRCFCVYSIDWRKIGASTRSAMASKLSFLIRRTRLSLHSACRLWMGTGRVPPLSLRPRCRWPTRMSRRSLFWKRRQSTIQTLTLRGKSASMSCVMAGSLLWPLPTSSTASSCCLTAPMFVLSCFSPCLADDISFGFLCRSTILFPTELTENGRRLICFERIPPSLPVRFWFWFRLLFAPSLL